MRRIRIFSALAIAAAVMTGGATAPAAQAQAQATESVTPAVITSGDTTDIAVEGPYNELTLYWANDGSNTWTPVTVAGAGTTYSMPAMVLSGNGVDITAAGPSGSLYDYWAENGSNNWSFSGAALPGGVG